MPTLSPASVCAAILCILVSCNQKNERAEGFTANETSVETKVLMPEAPIVTTSLGGFHESYHRHAVQRFTVPEKSIMKIEAAKGLRVMVDYTILEKENGAVVKGPIDVEILELTNSEDLFKSNTASLADGKLLVSGGSYYIGMNSEGQPLRIRKNKKLQVGFPVIKNGHMELFYGNRDNVGDMNWKRTGRNLQTLPQEMFFEDQRNPVVAVSTAITEATANIFKSMESQVYFYNKQMTLAALLDTVNRHEKKLCVELVSFWPKQIDTMKGPLDTSYLVKLYGPKFRYKVQHCATAEREAAMRKLANENRLNDQQAMARSNLLSEQIRQYYAPEGISRLGWINCDRFYEGRQLNQEVAIPITFTNTRIEYFVLFKSFSGLMKGSASVYEGQPISLGALPTGQEIILVAFTRKEGKYYHARKVFRTGRKEIPALDLKEIALGEMNKIFGKNLKT